MKVINCLILIVFFSSSLIGQVQELGNAMNRVNSRGFHEVNFSKHYSHKKIQKWIDQNDLLIVDSEYGNYMQFGKVKEGVVWLEFTTPRKYSEYLAMVDRNKRKRNSKINPALIGGIILGGAAIAGIKALSDYDSSEPYSRSSGACLENEDLYLERAFICEDKNGGKHYRPVFKIKCATGLKQSFYFYYIDYEVDRGTYHGTITVGFRKFTTNPLVNGGDFGYLGKTREEAISKLCNCD